MFNWALNIHLTKGLTFSTPFRTDEFSSTYASMPDGFRWTGIFDSFR